MDLLINNKDLRPLVSVGIPTFDRPQGIKRTLNYITQQTYKNIEIIVSDNCSPGKETESIVRSFMEKDGRIKYFRQEKNLGSNYNFKFVLKKATGKYFMWASDDDEWAHEFIEVCIDNIGYAGSIMTGFAVLYRTKNYSIDKPALNISTENTVYINATNFLNYLQPSLFYGIHLRETILCFLNEDYFDFFDCFFVLRQIMNNGFIVIPDKLYKACIDDKEYIKKPFRPKKGRIFEYGRFFNSCFILIIRNNSLNLFDRIKLSIRLIDTTLGLFSHEREVRPRQVMLICITRKAIYIMSMYLVIIWRYIYLSWLKRSLKGH